VLFRSSEQFKQFMATANKLLALNIASVPEYQKGGLQKEYMQSLIKVVDDWNLNTTPAITPQAFANVSPGLSLTLQP